jgi:hypothetical protein
MGKKMKNLLPFLIVILSMSIYAQEPQYWQKIDFEFDSDIKQIDMFQNPDGYWNVINNSFIILNSLDQIFYFSSVNQTPILIKIPDSNLVISKVKIVCNWDTTFIFVITENNNLLLTKDFGTTWKVFSDEIDNTEVTDIADYWDHYGHPLYNTSICISNTLGETYISKDFGNSWQKIINGLKDEKINQLIINSDGHIYAITKNNKLFVFIEHQNSWNIIEDLNENKIIKELRLINSSTSYVYLNEDNKLKYKEENQEIRIIGDSVVITCFTITEWAYLTTLFQFNKLPDGYLIIFGTDKNGIFLSCYWAGNYYEPEQYGDELTGKTITDIETNSLTCPSLCLVGTDDGEVYYSEFHYEPGNVQSNYNKLLNLNIIPQPAINKTGLSFTLPNNSKLSIKLYTTH